MGEGAAGFGRGLALGRCGGGGRLVRRPQSGRGDRWCPRAQRRICARGGTRRSSGSARGCARRAPGSSTSDGPRIRPTRGRSHCRVARNGRNLPRRSGVPCGNERRSGSTLTVDAVVRCPCGRSCAAGRPRRSIRRPLRFPRSIARGPTQLRGDLFRAGPSRRRPASAVGARRRAEGLPPPPVSGIGIRDPAPPPTVQPALFHAARDAGACLRHRHDRRRTHRQRGPGQLLPRHVRGGEDGARGSGHSAKPRVDSRARRCRNPTNPGAASTSPSSPPSSPVRPATCSATDSACGSSWTIARWRTTSRSSSTTWNATSCARKSGIRFGTASSRNGRRHCCMEAAVCLRGSWGASSSSRCVPRWSRSSSCSSPGSRRSRRHRAGSTSTLTGSG